MTTLDHRTPTVIENVKFVETPTGSPTPPPMPKPTVIDGVATDLTNPHRVHVNGALATLGLSVAGLVTTTITDPTLIAWPIGATFAMTVTAITAAVVHDRWADRNTLPTV